MEGLRSKQPERSEDAEREGALDKSHTPIFSMFLNDSLDRLSFLTELRLRVEQPTPAGTN